MSNQPEIETVDICGEVFSIPGSCQKLKSLPDDPAGSVIYGMQSNDINSLLIFYPVDEEHAMPIDRNDEISGAILQKLEKDQALVDVRSVRDGQGRKAVYTVVKTEINPDNFQFNLTLQIKLSDSVLHLQGYFEGRSASAANRPDVLTALHSFINVLLGTDEFQPEHTGDTQDDSLWQPKDYQLKVVCPHWQAN